MSKTGGFASAPQTMLRIAEGGSIVGAVEPGGTARHLSPKTSQEKGDAGPDPAIIHPRFVAWYKMGGNYLQGNAASRAFQASAAAASCRVSG